MADSLKYRGREKEKGGKKKFLLERINFLPSFLSSFRGEIGAV